MREDAVLGPRDHRFWQRARTSSWAWANMTAREYRQLLSGSEFSEDGEVEILLREGKQTEAVQHLKALPAVYGWPVLQPCLQSHSSPSRDSGAQKVRSVLMADNDPFPKYVLAAWDSLCSRPEFAFRELRRAIEQDYCAYPQMETESSVGQSARDAGIRRNPLGRQVLPAAFLGTP
jgi:hypothetical protein